MHTREQCVYYQTAYSIQYSTEFTLDRLQEDMLLFQHKFLVETMGEPVHEGRVGVFILFKQHWKHLLAYIIPFSRVTLKMIMWQE